MAASPIALPPDARGGPSSVSDEARNRRLRQLVDAHFAGIWRFLRHLGVPADLVDDAAQDVFLVASRRLDDIAAESEYAFLFSTAFRVGRALVRKRSREPPMADIDAAEETEQETAPTPEEKLDDERALALAYRLLGQLEEELRLTFVMHEIEELTVPQIANLTGMPVTRVASRLRRAREEFRTQLERHRRRSRGTR